MGDDAERALSEFLDDRSTTSPGENVDATLLKERIAEVLKSLTPREREVIEMRFGLKDGTPRTLDSRPYDITREHPPDRGLAGCVNPIRSSTGEFTERDK